MAEIAERKQHFSKKLPPQTFTAAEIAALLKQCHERYFTGLRDKTIILLMWRCALRVSEVLALAPEDIDFTHCAIDVLHGKGDKARVVGFDPQLGAALQKWLVRREKAGFADHALLFCTSKGQPILTSHLRNKIKRLGIKAGIRKRVHCHGLRHTAAKEMLCEGLNLGIIQGQLGHEHVSTTSRYLQKLCPRDVIQAMKQRSW